MSVFRDDILSGKVAFITGGGSGICKGITRALMAHGANAAIASRKLERLQDSADELANATGRRCVAVQADVREPEQVAAHNPAPPKKITAAPKQIATPKPPPEKVSAPKPATTPKPPPEKPKPAPTPEPADPFADRL